MLAGEIALYTWTGNAGDAWNVDTNWTPNGHPQLPGHIAVFDDSAASVGAVNLPGGTSSAGELRFGNTSGSYDLNGGSLQLGSATQAGKILQTTNVANVISSPVAGAGGGFSVDVQAGSLDFAGGLNAPGTVDLEVAPAASLSVSGPLNAGTVNVNSGVVTTGPSATVDTLDLRGGGTVNAGANTVAIGTEMTLDNGTYTGSFGAGGTITKDGVERLELNGGTVTITPPPAVGDRIPVADATASSFYQPDGRIPNDAVNNVGMHTDLDSDGNFDLHNNNPRDMWLTNNATAGEWLKLDLGSVESIGDLKVWNYNENSNNPGLFTGRGIQNATVYYSDSATDPGAPGGAGWTSLGDYSFAKAPGTGSNSLPATDVFDLGGINARWLAFEVISNYGADNYTGLSELQVYEFSSGAIDFSGTDLVVNADSTLSVGTSAPLTFKNLSLNGSLVLDTAASAVSFGAVSGDGTLSGSGPLTTTIRDSVAPGLSPGTLNFAGPLVLSDTNADGNALGGPMTYFWELGPAAQDLVISTDLSILDPLTVVLMDDGALQYATTEFDLFQFSGTFTGSGPFLTSGDLSDLITLDTSLVAGLSNWDVSGLGIAFDGNSIYLTGLQIGANVIPEPSTFVLAALGLLGLAACARRRRQSALGSR